jgi:hypothetical protein
VSRHSIRPSLLTPGPRRGGKTVTGCTNWAITLFLGQHGQAFLIGASPAGYHPYHHACD